MGREDDFGLHKILDGYTSRPDDADPATVELRTGDHVRLDGSTGRLEVLRRAR